MAADELFKYRPEWQMEKVAENAGYLRQGCGPPRAGAILAGTFSFSWQGLAIQTAAVIWTRMKVHIARVWLGSSQTVGIPLPCGKFTLASINIAVGKSGV
jgi:hypothetical protein